MIGERLPSSPGVRTFSLELREEGHGAEEGGRHGHAGGSVAGYASADAAEEELANCRQSAAASGALYCLRVANVLVILGGDIGPAEFERVRAAAAAAG